MNLPDVHYRRDMDAVRSAEIDRIKAAVEKPHDRIVYGRPVAVRPTFCDAVIGDGAYLLVVTPVRTVPDYHAILVDSSWVMPGFRPLSTNGLEADLDDPDRRDLLVEVLKSTCGDADAWHDEHGESEIAPHGLFHADMGFYWGVETIASLFEERQAA